MPAATKTVTGNLGNLSEEALASALLLFDLDPAFVVVDGSIIVGVINGGAKGVPVTPDPTTGDFTVDIVAVDNPTWTITVSVTGDGIETPIVMSIQPPPATGSGSVDFDSLIVTGSAGTAPVVVNSIRGASDYNNSVAPTLHQVIAWDGTDYAPDDPSGGSGLPTGGAPGQVLTINTDGDPVWATPATALTEGVANGLYAPITAVPYILVETDGEYAGRATVTSDMDHVVIWYGEDDATITPTFAQGVDVWWKKPT